MIGLLDCAGRTTSTAPRPSSPIQHSQPDVQASQSNQQSRNRQNDADFEIIAPGDADAFAGKDVQPQQGGERADRSHLRAQVGADDVGVDERFAKDAFGCRSVDGERSDHDGRQVVHDRGEHGRDQPHADRGGEQAGSGQTLQYAPEHIGQARVAQAVDDDVHADRENHDGPRRLDDYFLRPDDRAAPGHEQEQDRHGPGNERNRHDDPLADQVSRQQHAQNEPREAEQPPILDRLGRLLQSGDVVACRHVSAEYGIQDGDAGRQREQVHDEHPRSVFDKADAEIVRRHDVRQVADNKWQRSRIRDKAARHDERQDAGLLQPKRPDLGQHDRRQDKRRSVVGEEGGDARPEQDDVYEHPLAVASREPGHVQRGPFEEADFVQDDRDDDQRDKSKRRVPDDTRHRRYVVPADDADQQSQQSSARSRPADAELLRLPDDERHRNDKKNYGQYGCYHFVQSP